jgi:lysozyme
LHEGADWSFWQYANRGRVPGVATFIDLNVYSGSAAQFREFRCTRQA